MARMFLYILLILIFASSFSNVDTKLKYENEMFFQDSILKSYKKNGFKYQDVYKKNILVQRKIFDGGKKLLYESPLKKSKLSKTKFLLKSGNNFLEKGKTDTLEIDNETVPMMNKGMEVKGASISPIGLFKYQINPSKVNLDSVTVYLKVFQEMNGKNNIPEFILDSIIIPVRSSKF